MHEATLRRYQSVYNW